MYGECSGICSDLVTLQRTVREGAPAQDTCWKSDTAVQERVKSFFGKSEFLVNMHELLWLVKILGMM